MTSELEISRAEHEAALEMLKQHDFDGKVIDYTRALDEYPTKEKVAEGLRDDNIHRHIYTETLNVNGRVVQDEMEKYLDTDALSSSMLKAALKTPLDFEFAKSEDKEELEKMKGGKHFSIGTFLHQCLLEPTKFKRAVVEPKYSLASHEGCDVAIAFYEGLLTERGIELPAVPYESIQTKKNYIEALKKAADIEPVTEEHKLKINILERRVNMYAGGIIQKLLLHSKREVSVYYRDPETNLDLKVRPDAIQFEENIGVNAIISVKSTACEDLSAFFTHAAKLHYDLSEGMYQEVVSAATGRDFNTTIMIMLQTVAPYHIAVLVWKAEDIEMGKYKYRMALDNASQIMSNGSVKGYDAYSEEQDLGLIDMNLPAWNQKEYLPINI